MRHGIHTIEDLAHSDVAALIAADVPPDGLDRLRAQAAALLDGRVSTRRAVGLPRGVRRELYLRIETDPLDRGEPFSVSWGEAEAGGPLVATRVAIVSSDKARADALCQLIEVLESPAARGEPVYTYGSGTASAFDALAEGAGIEPGRTGDLAGRFVDLGPWVRRAAVLPVFRYRFDEVAAVARGLSRPSPGTADDALFVLHAGLAASPDPAEVRRRLEEAGRNALTSLHAIRAWFAS
jgi:predicted RecB family nuclease